MMKRLLTLILIVAAMAANGQVTGFVPYKSKVNYIGIASDSLAYMPVKDTTHTPARLGAYTMRPQDSCVYIGISTTLGTKRWLKLGSMNDIPINYADSLRRSGLSVQMRKNGNWNTQFNLPDSTGGSSLTFTNGLTESGGTVKLGSTLTEQTTIDGQEPLTISISNIDGGQVIVDAGIVEINAIKNSTGNPSKIKVGIDSINIFPPNGNLFVDSINTVSSTTGRKVLIHDTATGKVERVDPSVLGGGTPITVTKAQVVSLMNSSSLVSGSIYKITGVQPGLYDDGTSSGTTIFLKALSSNLLSKKGWGEFYNPRYDQSLTGCGVADTSASYSIGDTVFWGHYAWVCNTGGLAVATDILTMDANWDKLNYASGTIYTKVLDEVEYDINNDLIVSRREVDANNIVSCTKSGFDYLADNFGVVYYPISVFMWGNHYEYSTNKGVGGNIINESYFECTNLFDGNISSNTIINSGIYSNTLINSGIYSNTLSSGSISSNTLSSGNIYSNTISRSYISSNTLSSGSIYSNTLSSGSIYFNTLSSSSISSNTLSSGNIYSNTISSGSISSNTLSSGNISSNTLSSSNISSNTLSSSSISVGLSYELISKNIQYIIGEYGVINVDIRTATVVFGDYPKTLFRLPNGTMKLRYYNNSSTLVVTNVTD